MEDGDLAFRANSPLRFGVEGTGWCTGRRDPAYGWKQRQVRDRVSHLGANSPSLDRGRIGSGCRRAEGDKTVGVQASLMVAFPRRLSASRWPAPHSCSQGIKDPAKLAGAGNDENPPIASVVDANAIAAEFQ